MLWRTVPLIMCVALACSDDTSDPGADARANEPDAAEGQADASADQPDAAETVADCQINSALPWSILSETLQMKSADGSVCAVFRRRNDCPPDWICMAVPFTILEARIGNGASLYTQTDGNEMHWEATHHNWNDWAEVEHGEVRYRLDFIFGESPNYELSAIDIASGDTLWGPVQLDPVNPS